MLYPSLALSIPNPPPAAADFLSIPPSLPPSLPPRPPPNPPISVSLARPIPPLLSPTHPPSLARPPPVPHVEEQPVVHPLVHCHRDPAQAKPVTGHRREAAGPEAHEGADDPRGVDAGGERYEPALRGGGAAEAAAAAGAARSPLDSSPLCRGVRAAAADAAEVPRTDSALLDLFRIGRHAGAVKSSGVCGTLCAHVARPDSAAVRVSFPGGAQFGVNPAMRCLLRRTQAVLAPPTTYTHARAHLPGEWRSSCGCCPRCRPGHRLPRQSSWRTPASGTGAGPTAP